MSDSKENIVENNYISLQDASKLCEYSQEYLSLRARQGKLKSVKIGRNWVTKKEWLEEYILSAKNNGNNNRNNKGISKITNLKTEAPASSDIRKTICAPDDLPVGQFSESIQEFFVRKRNKNFSFVLSLILTCALLGGVAFLGKASLKSVFTDISSYAGKNLATVFEMAADSEAGRVLKNVSDNVISGIQESPRAQKASLGIASFINSISDATNNLWQKAKIFTKSVIAQSYQAMKFFVSPWTSSREDNTALKEELRKAKENAAVPVGISGKEEMSAPTAITEPASPTTNPPTIIKEIIVTGQQGSQGLQGLQGLQGSQGPQGLMGPQGLPGPTGSCSGGIILASSYVASSPPTLSVGANLDQLNIGRGNFTVNSGGTVYTAGSLTVSGSLTSGPATINSTLSLSSGSITDSTGAISFGDENLTTTGTLGAGATTVTSLKIPQIGGTAGKYNIFQGGANTADLTYTLPITLGAAGTVLTDAAGNGILSWVAGGSGGYTNLTSFVAQTAWRSFYSNADGDVVELAFGSIGKVLTSGGVSATPTWETPTVYETAGAVATHAALTTGIHGLVITAGQTLTVTTGGTLGTGAYATIANYLPLAGGTMSGDILVSGTVNTVNLGATGTRFSNIWGTTITGTTLTDGTTTITGGNYTGVGDITGTDVDISAGTGDYSSSGTLGAGAITGTSLSAGSGTLTAGIGTLTSINLTADTNQIVLNSDGGVAAITLTGTAATSAKTITFPDITGTVALTTGVGGLSSYLPLAGGTMSGAIAMGGQAITGAGAITGTTLTATAAGGLTLGTDTTTNIAGYMKLWSAGAVDWSTTFTAGTQTADATYTLPTAMATANSQALLGSTAGVLSWGTNFGANAITTSGTITGGDLTTGGTATLGDATTDIHGMNTAAAANQMLTASYSATTDVTSYFIKGTQTSSSDTTTSRNTYGYYLDQNISGTNTGNRKSPTSYGMYLDIDDTSVVDMINGPSSHSIYGVYSDVNFGGTNISASNEITVYGGRFNATGNMGTTGLTYHFGLYSNVSGTADVNYGLWINSGGATENYSLYVNTGNVFLGGDNILTYWGTANDASITFDSNSLNIVANAVTTTDDMEFTAESYTFKTNANTDLAVNFAGTTTSGVLTWMEDEDYFLFGDDINMGAETITTSGTLGAGAITGTSLSAGAGALTAGVGTLTSINLTADTNQIVLNSDGGVAAITLTGTAATSAKIITFPDITGTVALTAGVGGLSSYLPLAGGTMSGAIAMGGQAITGAGAITGTTLAATAAGGLTLGTDTATNIAGYMKLWSAGAVDWSTTFTAGTQTADATYTLPTAMAAANSQALLSSTAGVLSWGTDFGANAITTSGTLGAGAITGTSLSAGSGTLTAGIGTLTSINLTADTNQIVLNSDGGVAAITLTGTAATSAKTITFPDITGTVALTTGAGGLSSYLPLAGGTMSGAIAMGGQAITGGGAITGTTLAATAAGGLTLGTDVTTPTVNIPGYIKMWSAGDNAFYTTFTAGTQTADATYTLPTAKATANSQALLGSTTGVLSWGTNFGANAITTTGTGTFGVSGVKILETENVPTLYGIFSVADLTTANKTYTFPDITGTVALTTGVGGLSSYLPLAGGTMSGAIAMGGQAITGAGAITGTTLSATAAGGLTLGTDVTTPTVNIPGYIKMWSAGDNAFYTTFTAGTQTADATYTLPTAMATANSQALLGSTAGVLSWGTNFGANAITTSGTLGAGAITGTSLSAGSGALTTTGTGTFGKLVVNTSDLVVNAAGYENRVGIGTTAPSVALEIGSNTAGQAARISATLGSELAPALTTGNWTLGTGWQYLTTPNRLDKNADGTGTATPSAVTTIVAGTTYKVIIIVDSILGSTATYTLGGSTGTALAAATTYTDYITASTTGKLIITPVATGLRITISSISITALTTGTGDLFVEGNLKIGGIIHSSTGIDAIAISPSGNVGIGTTGPDSKLDVLDAANPQLRLTNTDGSIYTEFIVAASTGDLTVSLYGASANDITFNMPGGSTGANLWVCNGTACAATPPADGGNLILENALIFDNNFRMEQTAAATTTVYDSLNNEILIFDEVQ